MTLKVGLIGAGRIGHVHANTVRQVAGVQLMAIADANLTSAKNLAASLGADISLGAEATIEIMSTADLLKHPDIDAVIVASSTDTHASFTVEALRAGKAVFCEKPLDLNLHQASTVAKAAQETGSPLFVGFNRRFDPQFSAIKQRLLSGEIGQLEQLTITSRDPEPPPLEYVKVSGGLFRDMMIHDFDMSRYLLTEEPCSIFAQGASLVNPEIGKAGDIDTAMVVMTTASGQQVQIINSRRAAYGYDQRVEAFGAAGLLQAENVRQSTVKYLNKQGEVNSLPEAFFMERYAKAYALELAAFVQAVRDNTPLPVSGYDGVAALFLAERALESYETGRCIQFDLSASLEALLASPSHASD